MIVATALVLMMSVPGLALFYAGMVRKKNVLATMAQTFAATALVSVLWMAIAYSLTLAGGGAVIGTLSRVMLHGIGMDTVSPLAPTIPEALFMMYQMTFAVITVALVAGHLSASMGALTWMALEWWIRGKPSVLGMISGAVAGLGTITPASGFVLPWHGLIIGLIAGVVCFYSCTRLKIVCGYDDSLDVFGVHGVGGAVGTLLVGFFAARSVGNVSGLLEGHATAGAHPALRHRGHVRLVRDRNVCAVQGDLRLHGAARRPAKRDGRSRCDPARRGVAVIFTESQRA